MKDEKYQTHAMTLVKDVIPDTDINYLVNLFLMDASINMGSDFTDQALERIIFIVKSEYKFLPIAFIASAFSQGSMGKYGAGRLVPRTMAVWLNEAATEYNRKAAHEAIKDYEYLDAMNLNSCPVGSAICKKIDWYKNGTLKMKDWDSVPLKEIANKIKAGVHVYPQMFGIKYE